MLPARREEIEDSGQCTVGLNTVWVWQEAMLAHVIVVCIMSFAMWLCVCVCVAAIMTTIGSKSWSSECGLDCNGN